MPMPQRRTATLRLAPPPRQTDAGECQIELNTFMWERGVGWSAGALPDADSPETLVVARACFGGAPPPGEPTLALAVSCVGRRLVLGERSEDEIAAALDVLPAGTQQIGFYSYGELSPYLDDSSACELHNQTMTMTTLGER